MEALRLKRGVPPNVMRYRPMLHIHTILHPTDFSPFSEHAFHLACSLAREQGARIIVLHVPIVPMMAESGMLSPSPPLDGDWQAAIGQEVMDQLNRVRPADPNIVVEHRLEHGNPVTAILRVAAESKCDLIVMGTHGRTGLLRLLMGSVAEQVVRKAPCPVITVKSEPSEEMLSGSPESPATVVRAVTMPP
jgi:nucleotide-binding universal stress UspA family protein